MVQQKKTKHNGYTIEVADGFYLEDRIDHPPYYLTFPSIEDYHKVCDIEKVILELNNKKGIGENEDRFYKYLSKIEKPLKDCDKMDIRSNSEDSFTLGFPPIFEFYNEGYYLDKEKLRFVKKEFISIRVKKKYDNIKKLIDDKLTRDNCFMI